MSEAPTTYFLKEILSNKAWLPNGKLPAWEAVGNDTGVLATNDAFVIFHLNALAHRHVGGVVKIDAQQYADAKKNSPESVSPPSLQRGLSPSVGPTAAPAQIFPPNPPPVRPPIPDVAAAVAAVIEAKPPEPPQKVRVGRLKRTASTIP